MKKQPSTRIVEKQLELPLWDDQVETEQLVSVAPAKVVDFTIFLVEKQDAEATLKREGALNKLVDKAYRLCF